MRRALAVCILLLASIASAAAGPKIERVVSPGGIEAWLVHEPSIPIIALEAVWRDAGDKIVPDAQAGLAPLLSALMTEGAGDLDVQAFAAALQESGIGLSFGADRDHFSMSLRTLGAEAGKAFDLAALALAKPRIDAESLARLKRSTAVALVREQEQPNAIATRALYAAAFPDHAYGRPPRGTPESVQAMTRGDLLGFKDRELSRDRLVIGVVGDIKADQLGAALDKIFGGLPAASASREVVERAPVGNVKPIVIERDMPQSVVQFLNIGVRRNDPDYYAAYVMNYILGGGGFNSRLTVEVREKRGLAYSVYSYLIPLREAGIWQGGVGTKNEQAGESLRIIKAELDRMRNEGVSADELANAKTFLNGSFPLQLSSNAAIAGTLVSMQLYHLGADFLDKRADFINAVTLEDVRRVAKRLLDPANMLVVVVGKPAGLGG